MKKYSFWFLLLLLFFINFNISAQPSVKGEPAALKYNLETVNPVVLNIDTNNWQREVINENPAPLMAGVAIPVNQSDDIIGKWTKVNSGLYVWRAAFTVEGAKLLNLYFNDFNLEGNDQIFIYSADEDEILGAFTKKNNRQYFTTGLIKGNTLIVEYNTSDKKRKLPFEIDELGIVLRQGERGFGGAGSCEVPVNCDEGALWQRQKRSVARILVKESSSLFWCTGSLVNNTGMDGKPYFLTANHCGSNASSADYTEWVFDFDYESPDCSRPVIEPDKLTFTGASLIAHGSTPRSANSDFKLLLLNDEIPDDYHMYFSGWDRSGEVPQHGVVIHHPEGDIKFISTYTQPAVSSFYYGSENPDAPFWKVVWSETANGYGVTEGGSSGSPLFSEDGYIVGTLTGGNASCINNTEPDYFGKFSNSWDQNGTSESEQLKPWLDPLNTGVESLEGYYKGGNLLVANFGSPVKKILSGNYVEFVNLSQGNISEYHWEFEGGEPAVSSEKNPALIYYKNPGTYKVKLVVSSQDNSDTLIRDDYITVIGNLYPNPFILGNDLYQSVHILTGNTPVNNVKVYIADLAGHTVKELIPETGSTEISFSPVGLQAGTYIVTTDIYGDRTSYKLVIINTKPE